MKSSVGMTIRRNWLQTLVLVVAAIGLLLPLIGSARFGFFTHDGAFTFGEVQSAVSERDFTNQLILTVVLAVLTTLGLFVLIIPTLVWLHLKLPRALGFAEGLSLIPYVVPAVALVNGANLTFRPIAPAFLTYEYSLVPFYIILAMPLVYRTIDSGIRAIDLPTLVNASASLGAGWLRTIFSVIIPNLKASLVTGGLLAVTLVLGEFALAQLLLQNTFPVFLQGLGRNSPRAAAAMAFIVIVGTWLILSIFTRTDATGSTRARSIRRRSSQPLAEEDE